jgi:hypothetical protein
MGKKNNRNFYQIAYKQLIEKLEEKLKCINKKMILVKESYTSKCDALALESIGYYEIEIKEDYLNLQLKN